MIQRFKSHKLGVSTRFLGEIHKSAYDILTIGIDYSDALQDPADAISVANVSARKISTDTVDNTVLLSTECVVATCGTTEAGADYVQSDDYNFAVNGVLHGDWLVNQTQGFRARVDRLASTETTDLFYDRLYYDSAFGETEDGDDIAFFVANATILNGTAGQSYVLGFVVETYGGYIYQDQLMVHVDAAARISDVRIPTPPRLLRATDATEEEITLEWENDATARDGFQVYRNNTLIDTIAGGLSTYTATGLVTGTQYSFKIRAFKNPAAVATDFSYYSNTAIGTTDSGGGA